MSCSPGSHAQGDSGFPALLPQKDRMFRAKTDWMRYVYGAATLAATLMCTTTLLAQKSKRPKTRSKTPAVEARRCARTVPCGRNSGVPRLVFEVLRQRRQNRNVRRRAAEFLRAPGVAFSCCRAYHGYYATALRH